jgi:hypothetical protein
VEVWPGRYLWEWSGRPGQKDSGSGLVKCAPNLVPEEVHVGHGREEGAVGCDCWERSVASGQEEVAGYGREGKAAEAPAY